MFEKPGCEELKMGDDRAGSESKEPLKRGNIHRVSLQTREGKTLIGVPVTVGATETVPRVLLAPLRAAICATAMVVKIARLKIVIEREAG